MLCFAVCEISYIFSAFVSEHRLSWFQEHNPCSQFYWLNPVRWRYAQKKALNSLAKQHVVFKYQNPSAQTATNVFEELLWLCHVLFFISTSMPQTSYKHGKNTDALPAFGGMPQTNI